MLHDMMLCDELFHTPSGVAFADFITRENQNSTCRTLSDSRVR